MAKKKNDSKNADDAFNDITKTKDSTATTTTTHYTEIYCANCKKSLGRYNTKFYSEDKIMASLGTIHSTHIRDGHTINVRNLKA